MVIFRTSEAGNSLGARHMNRTVLVQQLEEAERNIAQGASQLAQQEATIAKLDRKGCDTQQARIILATLRDTQAFHQQERERILKELEKLGRLT
jgi:hypothetical protein